MHKIYKIAMLLCCALFCMSCQAKAASKSDNSANDEFVATTTVAIPTKIAGFELCKQYPNRFVYKTTFLTYFDKIYVDYSSANCGTGKIHMLTTVDDFYYASCFWNGISLYSNCDDILCEIRIENISTDFDFCESQYETLKKRLADKYGKAKTCSNSNLSMYLWSDGNTTVYVAFAKFDGTKYGVAVGYRNNKLSYSLEQSRNTEL